MIVVKGLIWDDWNKEHIAKHAITLEEVEEVCHGRNEVVESYRKRLLITGKTKQGKLLAIYYHLKIETYNYMEMVCIIQLLHLKRR